MTCHRACCRCIYLAALKNNRKMRKFHWFDDGRPKSNQKVSKQRLTGRNGQVWRLLWLKAWKLWGLSRWDAMFCLWHAMPVTWASQFIKSLFKALPNLLKSSTSSELSLISSSFWQASLIHLFEGRQTNGMKQSGACFRWRHVMWSRLSFYSCAAKRNVRSCLLLQVSCDSDPIPNYCASPDVNSHVQVFK